MRTYEHWIAGKPTPGGSQRLGDVFDPARGTTQAQVRLATPDDIDIAVAAARSAFEAWRETSVIARARIMFNFRQLLVDHEDELAHLISAEHGKTIEDARGEVVRGREVVELQPAFLSYSRGTSTTKCPAGSTRTRSANRSV